MINIATKGLLKSSFYKSLCLSRKSCGAFTLSWNFYEFWDGPMPGYEILLFLGNLTLVYVWHPLFTEEVDLYPKLALILLGQFLIVTGVAQALKFIIQIVKEK